MRARFLIPALFLAALTTTAVADAGWQHTVAQKFNSGGTSLKITDPSGFKVSIVVGGQPKEDTVPAIFPLPDQDAFLPVTITALDGKSWTQKVEIKARQQTELTVKYEADGKPAPAATADRKFIGHVVNYFGRCGFNAELKVEFLRPGDGGLAGEVIVPMNSQQTMEVPKGTYDVRVYSKDANAKAFSYLNTSNTVVEQDKWLFAWGCRSKTDKKSSKL